MPRNQGMKQGWKHQNYGLFVRVNWNENHLIFILGSFIVTARQFEASSAEHSPPSHQTGPGTLNFDELEWPGSPSDDSELGLFEATTQVSYMCVFEQTSLAQWISSCFSQWCEGRRLPDLQHTPSHTHRLLRHAMCWVKQARCFVSVPPFVAASIHSMLKCLGAKMFV